MTTSPLSRYLRKNRAATLAVLGILAAPPTSSAQLPLPLEKTNRAAVEHHGPSEESASQLPVTFGLEHHEAARGEGPHSRRVTILKDVPQPTAEELQQMAGAHVQGYDLVVDEWEEEGPADSEPRRRLEITTEDPQAEPSTRGIIAGPPNPGEHVREFEGEDYTGSFPPDTVVAVGSQHVVEAVNRGITVYDKFGNLVQSYRSFAGFFDNPTGMSLFDPKIIWSETHEKFALLVLGRDTTAQDSRFYLAISSGPNALEEWAWWSWNAESFGDGDAWLDFASLGGDEWGLYVTGNMMQWGAGFKHSKLWAISPTAWNHGSPSNWVWVDLEWPNGSNAYSLEVAHPHTSAFDEATFFVNTYTVSGSDALIWKLVGNRGNGQGLSLTRALVDIDDYDTIGSNINQPGNATDIHGGRTSPGNAIYANRRVFFSQTTDPLDDGSRSALLTTKVHVDNHDAEWSHLLSPGANKYYFYPALALRGTSSSGNLAVFYSYTSSPDTIYPSSGFKLYTNQPTNSSGPNLLYQQGQESYVRFDSVGRNRWGDYSGADYDWQCGHLWGATEFAGVDNKWRTRIKAINGNGESTCSLMAVVSPNGGETLKGGDTIQVEWDRSAVPGGTSMYLFLNLGAGLPIPVGTDLPTSLSSLDFDIPNTPTSSARIFVGAWDGDQYQLFDWSDTVFTIQGTPDLVTEIEAPAQAYPGQEIDVPNTITNIGEASGAISVSIALSTNSTCSTSDTLLLTRIGGSVQPDQSNQATSTPTIPEDTEPGSYHLCAIADWSDTVEEFDETNNASDVPIEIVEVIFADGFESGATGAWSVVQP